MTKKSDAEREEARTKLREWLKPGDTVYTVLRHVARSGMSRDISIVLIRPDGETLHPNYSVAKAIGARLVNAHGYDAIRMGGCGQDMGFAIVYELGYALWPKGTGKPHGTRNGAPDSDGGYALKHRWL